MEELERFADLNLDEDEDWSKEKVVTHMETGTRNREVVITDTDTDYEKVCLDRWPNCVEEKRILDTRMSKLHDWKGFYNAMEERTKRFYEKRVFEQCREFGASSNIPTTSSKRQQAAKSNDLPYDYGTTAVAANSEFAVVLVLDDRSKPADGMLYTVSTSNYPKSNWRKSGQYVRGFQVGYLFRDVLWVVADNVILVYKLPRCELVYSFDVWQNCRVLLKENVNVIKATENTVAVVTRSRGFLVFGVVKRALYLLKWQNTNDGGTPVWQYTTLSIFMNMVAFGRSDGIVELWKIETPDNADPKMTHIQTYDWLAPTQTNSGKPVEPKRGVPILCIEMCGPKLAISTEQDMVMVNYNTTNRTTCILTDVATVVDMQIFGDMILVMSIDGGLSVGEFGSGRTYCNTQRSIEDAPNGCFAGQWVFCSGDIAGALFPNGNINVLNHASAK